MSFISAVLVASFHHRNGNQIDYAVPAFDSDNSNSPVALPDNLAVLPFLCIPDGAHSLADTSNNIDLDSNSEITNVGGEFVYFQIPQTVPTDPPIYGVSCVRQISASELSSKPADVTRSMVQKAVVVLVSVPALLLPDLVSKLALVTRAFFLQRDFSNLAIID
ncbi:late secretory pathway protein avl9, partial [Physocladia obscura]